MSEFSSDVGVLERVRFRVVGDEGDESSSVVADAGGSVVGDVFCLVGGGGRTFY